MVPRGPGRGGTRRPRRLRGEPPQKPDPGCGEEGPGSVLPPIPRARAGMLGRKAMAIRCDRVLLVEDDQDSLDTLRDVLLLAGISEVRCARSAGEVERTLASGFVPQVIVLELFLPGGRSGAVLAAELKHESAYAAIPIIAVSGDQRSLAACHDRLFAGRFRKPYSVSGLVREICWQCLVSAEGGTRLREPRRPGRLPVLPTPAVVRALRAQGMSWVQIARRLGCSPSSARAATFPAAAGPRAGAHPRSRSPSGAVRVRRR